MTINGGKPHAVGDRGQRFEVCYQLSDDATVRKFGWTEMLDVAENMVRSIELHPSMHDAEIIDRYDVAPSEHGKKMYLHTDGKYGSLSCTCEEACGMFCKGNRLECHSRQPTKCVACSLNYADFLSGE